jgi:hypothetical protein
MVNVTYTETSSDLVYYEADGTPIIYNLGDMAWSTYPSLFRLAAQTR